jgi:hypothetical protein
MDLLTNWTPPSTQRTAATGLRPHPREGWGQHSVADSGLRVGRASSLVPLCRASSHDGFSNCHRPQWANADVRPTKSCTDCHRIPTTPERRVRPGFSNSLPDCHCAEGCDRMSLSEISPRRLLAGGFVREPASSFSPLGGRIGRTAGGRDCIISRVFVQ